MVCFLLSAVYLYFFWDAWIFFKSHLRQAVFIGYLIFTIGNGGYIFVTKPTHLFIVQIILGIAGGILEPSWDGLFSANITEEKAAQFWSTWAGTRDIAIGIGALMGGLIVATYSLDLLFRVMLLRSNGQK